MRLISILAPILIIGACASYCGLPIGSQSRICAATPFDHPSLGAAIEGFRTTVEAWFGEERVEFDTYRAGGNMSLMPELLRQTVDDRCDLVFVVTTPAAQVARREVATNGIPVVYTAVTDPVGAGIVISMARDSLPITGVTDLFPVEEQVELFLAAAPNSRSAALLYNPSEQNSQVLVARTERALTARGITVQRRPTSDAQQVRETALEAARTNDMLIVNGDNMYTQHLEIVIGAAQETRTPLFVGDPDSVRRGAIATVSPDYQSLGRRAAEKAVQILTQGIFAGDVPSEDPQDFRYYLNARAAERMGLPLPVAALSKVRVWVGGE